MFTRDLKPGDCVYLYPFGWSTVKNVEPVELWGRIITFEADSHEEVVRKYWGHEDLDAI